MNESERIDGLTASYLKHMAGEGRDCRIEWKADFSKMQILIYAPFISPALLLDFLWKLPHIDERFEKTGINDVLQVTTRFKIRLCIDHGGQERCYAMKVYQFNTHQRSPNLEIELTPIPI